MPPGATISTARPKFEYAEARAWPLNPRGLVNKSNSLKSRFRVAPTISARDRATAYPDWNSEAEKTAVLEQLARARASFNALQ